jgi:signal transduction histidine kinase/ActR/RegA family two-component response regulator
VRERTPSSYAGGVGDGNEESARTGVDADGDASLVRWRARLLSGVLATAVLALLPGVLIQAWQWKDDPYERHSGLMLAVIGLGALTALARWRAPYQRRAAVLMAIGYLLTPVAMLTQGMNPGHFVAICTLATIAVLLYSARVAYFILGASAVCMALTAFLFAQGYASPPPHQLLDPRVPLNWLRVGLFTLFPSAMAAVATQYLLGKLRDTLHARSQLVIQLRDEIGQRERALAELERAQARLLHAEKLEAVGQLAAGIAHDFNNTLAVVALEAELLKRRSLEAVAVTRGAEALLSAAERGKHLTRQLLLFSRSEPAPRPVIDVTQAFDECVQALRRLLPSEITFELELAAETLGVCIPPSELQQIVLNLGINARDAMPDGGSLHISLARTRLSIEAAAALELGPGEYARLSCRDSGSGMDSVTLARLFEPFFTTKRPGRGTGLGLTNVWNIAQRCGGAVQAESHPARGATLRVYLPLSTLAPPAPTLQEEPAQAAELHGHETVLVVEDDIRVRALLVSLLADAGYKTLDAASVDAALALDRSHSDALDLVCTDVVMPGRPARELIAELRARRPNVGILVCSGHSEDEQIARGIRSGEFKHLGKPFTRLALLAAVRDALQRS